MAFAQSCDDLGKNCKVKLLNTPINFIDHDFTFDKNIFDKLNNSKEQKYNLDFVSYLNELFKLKSYNEFDYIK